MNISSYMFRHWSAFVRESTKTKDHKSSTPIQVLVAPSL